jgi:hypothetical protein
MHRVWLVLALLALCAPAAARGTWPDPASLAGSAPRPEILRVAVDYPEAGAVVSGTQPVFLTGWAVPAGQERPRRDIAVVLDVSESTLERFERSDAMPLRPASEDEDATLPGSVLEAEVAAARRLLRTLDSRYARVCVVTFSGEPAGRDVLPRRWREGLSYSAQTWVSLTNDWAAVEAALDAVAEAGAHGMTDMASGVERATAELVGGPQSGSDPDPAAHRIMVFMTDGIPTLPVPGDSWRNQAEVFRQVKRAASYGVRIHAFAVGQEALRGPFTVATMASETGGTFVPIRDPATLPEKLPMLPLSGLEDVRVRNLTTEEEALATQLRPDGSFDALVRLAPGSNRIEVSARATDGSRARSEFPLERRSDTDAEHNGTAPGDEAASLDERLLQRRGDLLEDDVARRREERRRELVDEIERERVALAERLEEQRRELELRLETRPPPAVGAPPATSGEAGEPGVRRPGAP